ncbi:MAG: septum site-determining protein MinC [Alphaproteobacteria bacterium]|nr:septum site-determining protein MinC [Alphaproteobacteria bacterium]MBV9554256.1 septum site-determining protein MinC [Alphaproteobacteria bacterium]
MAAGNIVQGALFTVMVVRAASLRDPGFEKALAQQIARSPRFFQSAPVVLDLRGVENLTEASDFDTVRDKLHTLTLTLVGVQNAQPAQLEAAIAAGLASFAPNSGAQARAGAAAVPPAPRTRVVGEPVRSGTQIYARGGDLVVTAPVSPGAELVADGNIHIYGALRGRALAGASGDAGARIFCTRLEAELISIAGRYLVSEQLPAGVQAAPVQVALVDDQLTITPN